MNASSDDAAGRSWDEAISLIGKGQCAAALTIFIRLHEEGHTGAAYVIGALLERGRGGIREDLAGAEEWYEKSAANPDDREAQYALARIIFKRNGLSDQEPGRLNHAIQLLEHLAHEKDALAALRLGLMYAEGMIVPQSLDRAEHLIAIAADQGYVWAKLQLSGIAWRKGHQLRAIALRLNALFSALLIFFQKPNDKRLVFMHRGVNINEYPVFHDPQAWPLFSD